MNAGFSLTAIWAVRDVPLNVLGGNAKAVLYALISYADARGRIEVDLLRLRAAIDLGKTTVMRELDRLVLLNALTVVRRGTGSASSVYQINVDHLQSMRGMDPASSRPQSPRGVSARENVSPAVPRSDSESWRFRVETSVVPGLEVGGSNAEPIEDDLRIPSEEREDSATPPTSRSPNASRPSQLTPHPMPAQEQPSQKKEPEFQKPLARRGRGPRQPALPGINLGPKVAKGGNEWASYRDAFAAGVEDALGRPFAAPPVKGPQDGLVIALGVHARDDGGKIGGAELLTWIRSNAAVWAKQADEPERFPYQEFVRWLNSGVHRRTQAQPTVAKRPAYVPLPATQPVASPAHSADTEEFLARVRAAKPLIAPMAKVPS